MSRSTSCCVGNLSGIRPSTVFKRAKKEFGTTRDPNEAGWLLPDGSMLDFSEKNEGGPPGQRSLDHRSIERVVPYDEGENRYRVMMRFCEAGAIRLHTQPEYVAADACRPLTPEQRGAMRKIIDRSVMVTLSAACPGDDRNDREWNREERNFPSSAPLEWLQAMVQNCKKRRR